MKLCSLRDMILMTCQITGVYIVHAFGVSFDGLIAQCLGQLVHSAWKCFWMNVGTEDLRSSSPGMMLKRLETSVYPVLLL